MKSQSTKQQNNYLVQCDGNTYQLHFLNNVIYHTEIQTYFCQNIHYSIFDVLKA